MSLTSSFTLNGWAPPSTISGARSQISTQRLVASTQASNMMSVPKISLLGRFSCTAMRALRAVPSAAQRSSAVKAYSVQTTVAEPEEAPKKPNSAYITFVQDNYKSVKAKQPDAKSTEIMSLLGKEWKALAAHQKEKYKAEAAKLKAAYDAKYPPGSLPKKTPKAKKTKAATDGGEPKVKRAPTAYNLYMAQRLPALRKPGEAANVAMSMVAKEWKTLSQTEKDEWKTKTASKSAPSP